MPPSRLLLLQEAVALLAGEGGGGWGGGRGDTQHVEWLHMQGWLGILPQPLTLKLNLYIGTQAQAKQLCAGCCQGSDSQHVVGVGLSVLHSDYDTPQPMHAAAGSAVY